MHTRVIADVGTRTRALLALGLLFGGLGLGVAGFDVDRARANDAPPNRSLANAPSARASKVEAVNQHMTFEITQIKGNVIYAQGRSLGQFNGTASLYMTLVNASHAVAQIYARNSHGTLQGTGAALYHASGAVSVFSGGNPTLHGSGKYADVKSLGIKMTGVMNRRTLKIAIQLHGKWEV